MDQSVDELLEQEEKKAFEKNAAKARSSDGVNSTPDRRDPRSGGRNRGSRNNDRYSAEREENDARRSRKSKDAGEDVDMKDTSDKGSANGSVLNRRRSRSPEPRHLSHESEPAYRDRRDERDRDDNYRPGGNRRSTDHAEDDDRYYRPNGRSRREDEHRPRDRRDDRRERTDRDADRSYRARDGRERRRSPQPLPKKPRTPEPTDDERDRRTVFVQQLAARLRTKELQQFFQQVGPVVEAQIVKDRVSGRSKG